MNQKSPQKQYNNYLRYSGIGLQLFATVFLGTYLGFWLDKHFDTQKPIFSIVLGALSVVLGIVFVTRELLKNK